MRRVCNVQAPECLRYMVRRVHFFLISYIDFIDEPDLSVLPKSAPNLLLSAPTTATPAAIAVAILFSVVFFVTFTAISFRHKMGTKLSGILEKPAVQRFAAWIGFFSFVIGAEIS